MRRRSVCGRPVNIPFWGAGYVRGLPMRRRSMCGGRHIHIYGVQSMYVGYPCAGAACAGGPSHSHFGVQALSNVYILSITIRLLIAALHAYHGLRMLSWAMLA